MDILFAHNGAFYYNIRGVAEGTSYNIIYQDDEDRNFKVDIESILSRFEKSLSVYDRNSLISRINRNEDVETDNYFAEVFTKAKAISEYTEGAFDISAEPLFRAWGFSFQEKNKPTTSELDEMKKSIGMDKIKLEGGKIIKQSPHIVLNMNAIAKGYSADIVADFLDISGCQHYLVEIGGEIRVKGENPDGEAWRIGIDKPSEANQIPGQDVLATLQLTNKGLATSGNYRQFYIDEQGQKIAHTINPATGYPISHNLLSTTVIAKDAMTADAFATAFMVAGIDKAADWINGYEELDAVFICDENGEYKIYYTEGIEKNIKIE